jgi:Protein of unknown function (DUF3617)
MIMSWSGRLMAAASLVLVVPAVQSDERPGNLWQTTSQMSMPGMPAMPTQSMQLCTAKEWNQPPPPPAGQTCSQTNVQRTDNKITWSVACTGEMEMSGEGEITFESEDSYSGKILFNAAGMTMTVNLAGTKIGECDNPVS